MSKKHLIFGATGAIGSSLASQMHSSGEDCQLIGLNESELKLLAEKLNYDYSICDVLQEDFSKKILEELSSVEILSITYSVGSIDLKPFRLTKTRDFISSFIK